MKLEDNHQQRLPLINKPVVIGAGAEAGIVLSLIDDLNGRVADPIYVDPIGKAKGFGVGLRNIEPSPYSLDGWLGDISSAYHYVVYRGIGDTGVWVAALAKIASACISWEIGGISAEGMVFNGVIKHHKAHVADGLVLIGPGTILNTGCIIEHDCSLGANVFIGPGAILCGNVSVGDNACIGAGAVICPGVTIGAGAKVDAGLRVTRDVKENTRLRKDPDYVIINLTK